jgi:EcsC family protein
VNSIGLLLGFAYPTHLLSGMRGRENGEPLAETACHRHIRRVQRDGGRMIGEAAATIRKWTETARAARVPGIATALDALEWVYGRAVAGVPGLDGAEALAVSYAGRYATTDVAVATLIARQSGKAGVAGFVTGCGGAIALPVALPVNLLSTLYIQLRLVAAIAHLRGHDLHSAEVRTLALACLTGSKAADTLKDAGIRLGTRLTRDTLGWLSPALVKHAEHAARLPVLNGIAAAGAARLGRLVPLVGGVVAGGFDAAMTQLIGRTADRVYRQLKRPQEADQGIAIRR